MDDVEEFLRRQIGPFPVWQWIVIVIVGILLAWAIRRSFPGDADKSDGAPVDPFNPFAGTQPTGGAIFNPTYAGVGEGSGGGAAEKPEMPESNREWLARASKLLRETGGYGAAAVDQALRLYLQGRPLNAEQFGIVDAAIAAAGPPPEGAPPIKQETPPPSSPGPTRQPTPPAPTVSGDALLEQRIRALFRKHCLTRIADNDETERERLNRLVREVRAGRTLADIDRNLAVFSKCR